jgi:hypothetical protein
MALPRRTSEERAAALEKAAMARRERIEVKQRLKRGATTLHDVLKESQVNQAIGGMRLSALLQALPGIGRVRALRIMDSLGVSGTRRLRSLGVNQLAALESIESEGYYFSEIRPEFSKLVRPRIRRSTRNRQRSRPNDRADEISVAIYLDTDAADVAALCVRYVDELVEALGYNGPIDAVTESGSFIRHSWARIKRSLTSEEVTERLIKAERAVELRYLDSYQVEVDSKIADTVTKLVQSLEGVPNACIRAGSLLLIKYTRDERPVLLTRNLSQQEIKTLEKFPGIQQDPQKTLESLALALAEDTEPESLLP